MTTSEMHIETGLWLVRESERLIKQCKPVASARQKRTANHIKSRMNQWKRDMDRA